MMTKKYFHIGTVAGILCAASLLSHTVSANAGFTGAKADKSQYNVIFHIDTGGEATIKKTLNNIENLLNDPRLKGKVHIELLANSKGYALYVKNNGFEKKLKGLQKEGVILSQCSNTLKELHVDRGDLYPFISIVPSGMGEITIREAEGWAYIHPTPPTQQGF
ncbi:MAG: DsrE family protein [Sulfuricaulis sp.]